LHRFRDIAGFCARDPPLFHPILEVFPLDQIADVGVSLSTYLKPFSRVIIFEVFQSALNIPERDSQTDGRLTVA